MSRTIDGYVADVEYVLLSAWRCGAPKNRLYPQHHLGRTEWFGQIVIGAQRQSADTVGLFASSGQHEHRHVSGRLVAAQPFQNVESRHPGQHQVEDEKRGNLTARLLESIGSAGRSRHPESRFREVVGDERNDMRLIIDYEDSLASRGGLIHAGKLRRESFGQSTAILSRSRHKRPDTRYPIFDARYPVSAIAHPVPSQPVCLESSLGWRSPSTQTPYLKYEEHSDFHCISCPQCMQNGAGPCAGCRRRRIIRSGGPRYDRHSWSHQRMGLLR